MIFQIISQKNGGDWKWADGETSSSRLCPSHIIVFSPNLLRDDPVRLHFFLLGDAGVDQAKVNVTVVGAESGQNGAEQFNLQRVNAGLGAKALLQFVNKLLDGCSSLIRQAIGFVEGGDHFVKPCRERMRQWHFVVVAVVCGISVHTAAIRIGFWLIGNLTGGGKKLSYFTKRSKNGWGRAKGKFALENWINLRIWIIYKNFILLKLSHNYLHPLNIIGITFEFSNFRWHNLWHSKKNFSIPFLTLTIWFKNNCIWFSSVFCTGYKISNPCF